MTTCQLYGTLTAADPGARTIAGRLLPFGEAGSTSAGRLTAAAGVVELPATPGDVLLNLGHDRDRPAGRATSLVESAGGIDAVFSIANVPAGDQLLAEAAEGLRTGLSVELDGIVVRGGRLLAGVLTHVGAVTTPAFQSARLAAAAHPDAGDQLVAADYSTEATTVEEYVDETTGQRVRVTTERIESTTTEELAPAETDPDAETDPEAAPATPAALPESETVTAAATRPIVPATRRPAAVPGSLRAAASSTPAAPTLSDAFRLVASAYRTGDTAQLTAALSDVVVGGPTGIGATTTTPAWLGELWSGRAFSRRFVPLTNHGDLTSMRVAGWRWVTKPAMADYAGDKAAIPSGPVSVEPDDAVAERCAGGWDVDRAFFDFPNEGFVESFFRALTESYARLSDARCGQAIYDAAAANVTTPGPVPADVNPGMAAIVDGALGILDEGLPSYAILSNDLYRDALLTRSDDTLAYLNASLGLEDGTVGSFRVIPGGTLFAPGVSAAIVGAREALTFYELGETPIRVEAERVDRGGRDLAVFGYTASIVNDGDATTLVVVDDGA